MGDAMFYGSGAGKLPTASAVVADIVEIAKHPNKHIPIEWKQDKLELVDFKDFDHKFFVRTSASEDESSSIFGQVDFMTAEGVSNEIGFVTGIMSEAEFEKRSGQLSSVIQVIRVK